MLHGALVAGHWMMVNITVSPNINSSSAEPLQYSSHGKGLFTPLNGASHTKCPLREVTGNCTESQPKPTTHLPKSIFKYHRSNSLLQVQASTWKQLATIYNTWLKKQVKLKVCNCLNYSALWHVRSHHSPQFPGFELLNCIIRSIV